MLSTFSHEIFLSYGWAGNADPDRGARAWAAQLRDKLQDILGANLQSPRIYFDETESRTGPIPDRLSQAVTQSALMVFLVSPGSCRPTSWCQKEVTHFWDNARPLISGPEVVPPEHRIFKVTQSALAGGGNLVDPLLRWQLSSFDLCDTLDTPDGPTTLAGDLQNPSLRVAQALHSLAANLRTSLERIQALEQNPPSGLRVFLGPTFRSADERFLTLRRELLLQGHEVRSATPLPFEAETENHHSVRVDEAMEGCRLAVHLIPETLPANGWQRNPAALQLRKSLRRSNQNGAFAAYLWHDPDKPAPFDAQCRQEMEENPLAAGDQNIKGKDFAYLIENVKDRLRRPLAPGPPDPNITYDVVIEHHDYDSLEAGRIRDYIRLKGCRAQLANPTSPTKDNRLKREKKNAELFYSRARRFVVLYGQTTGEWANDVCYAMRKCIPPGTLRPGLVIAAPPPGAPRNKSVFDAPVPEFETRQCPDGDYTAALDEWLGGPCR